MEIIKFLGIFFTAFTTVINFENFEIYLDHFPRNSVEYIRETICNIETNVIHVYFDENRTSITTNNLLRKLNSCTSAPVLVKTYHMEINKEKINLRKYVSIHVLIVQENRADRINNAIRVIPQKVEGKQHLKYFMIFESIDDSDPNWISMLLKQLWEKRLLNVIIMYFNGNRVQSFTHHPFTPDGFVVIELSDFPQSTWYWDKLTDLRGMVMNVSMIDDEIRSIPKKNGYGFEGFDGYLAELIGIKLNTKFNYIQPLDNETFGSFENNITSGGLADVTMDRAEFSFNGRFLNPDFQENHVETTNSYEREDMCVIVPNAGLKPTFYNIFRTMSRITWACIIISILLTVTIYNSVQSLLYHKVLRNYEEKKKQTWFDTFMILNQCFYGNSIRKRIPKSTPLRLIFIGWVFYCFLMTSSYTGKLVSKLANPQYRDDIETLEDLEKSGLEIVVQSSFVPILEENLEPGFWNAIKNRITPLKTKAFKEHLNQNRSNFAYAMKSYRAEYAIFRNFDKVTGRPHYHKMQDCLIYYPKTYIVAQGSPYLGRVNELISRFHEVGLIRFWEQLSEFQATIKGKLIDDDEDEENDDEEDEDVKVILSIEHLQGAFYILIFGLAFSLIVFFIEIGWDRYTEYKRSLVVYF